MQERRSGGIQLIHYADTEAVGQAAAELVGSCLREKPDSAIVFPTGHTPQIMYRILCENKALDWSQSRLFHLDEYVPPTGISDSEGYPYESFETAIRQALWDFIGGRKFFFKDYIEHPEAYEALVTENQGPDLVILGIGANGHIAFNEPPSGPASSTRRVTLSPSTIQANFGSHALSDARFPSEAVTLGLHPILQAHRILLLATGSGKRPIVQRAFDPHMPPNADCPASWLKRHSQVTVMTDFSLETT